jgi:transcriptional regulator GlxA family with amidase domain
LNKSIAARRIEVFVVVPPRPMLLDISGPMDVLRQANRAQGDLMFDVCYVGPSPTVTTSVGVQLAGIQPLPESVPDDAMVVLVGDVQELMTGFETNHPEQDNEDRERIVAWLRAIIRPSHRLVLICSGALLAARAGLLNGRSCTTHHASCAELAQLAPRARVFDNRLYVQDGNYYSSAGVTAGIDLMLHVVAQLTNHACAAAVARYLVVYMRRSGGDPQLSPWFEGRNHLHPSIHRIQDAIAANPVKPWTLATLARLAGASSRHLSRLFHEHASMSITEYKNRLRVALAHDLLSQTQLDMERVAERSGFGSTRQLRRAWKQFHGSAPRETRRHLET